jgi:hypothetical protein
MLDFRSVPPGGDFVLNFRRGGSALNKLNKLDKRWTNHSSNLTLGVGIYNGGQRHVMLGDV